MSSELESDKEYTDYYTDITLETDNLNFKFPDSNDDVLKAITLKMEQTNIRMLMLLL